MELPTSRQEVTDYNPKRMLLYGLPKSGKSTVVSELEDNLILDLEDGYRSLPVMRLKIRNAADLKEAKKLIHAKAKELKKKPYKYITIDNVTRLEEMVLPVAEELHRAKDPDWGTKIDPVTGQQVIDKTADIRDLKYGRGYGYIRDLVQDFITMFEPYCNTIILIAHQKDKEVDKNSGKMTEVSPDLPGKLSQIVCGMMDAVGLVYRRGNRTFISFEGGDDTLKEARPLHLRGKVFCVAESDEENNIKIDMSQIFI